jgi:hypothetical protein
LREKNAIRGNKKLRSTGWFDIERERERERKECERERERE